MGKLVTVLFLPDQLELATFSFDLKWKKGYDKNGWPYIWGRHEKAIFQGKEYDIEEVDGKLQNIMKNIFHSLDDAAKKYGMEGNYVAGANIAGFLKVAEAMKAQGIV